MADLVQRLRDYPSYEECLQAADRIEALETRWDLQVDNAVRMAAERISQLEAALREIGYGAIGHGDVWDIARRALEAKP